MYVHVSKCYVTKLPLKMSAMQHLNGLSTGRGGVDNLSVHVCVGVRDHSDNNSIYSG